MSSNKRACYTKHSNVPNASKHVRSIYSTRHPWNQMCLFSQAQCRAERRRATQSDTERHRRDARAAQSKRSIRHFKANSLAIPQRGASSLEQHRERQHRPQKPLLTCASRRTPLKPGYCRPHPHLDRHPRQPRSRLH